MGRVSHQGMEAVYREGKKLARVVIEAIETDRRLMALTLRQVPTRGFINNWPALLSISSAWDSLYYDDHRWSQPNVPWNLYFGDRLVDAAVEYADTLPDDADFYGLICKFIYEALDKFEKK